MTNGRKAPAGRGEQIRKRLARLWSPRGAGLKPGSRKPILLHVVGKPCAFGRLDANGVGWQDFNALPEMGTRGIQAIALVYPTLTAGYVHCSDGTVWRVDGLFSAAPALRLFGWVP